MKKFIFALMIIMFAFSITAQSADQAIVKWDNPTTRMDGSVFDPTKEISVFKVYYGTMNPPTVVITVPVTTSYPSKAIGQTYTISGLANSTAYYFAVTVVDLQGQESNMSMIVNKTTRPPASPGGCSNVSVQ